jgi:hypothetical protein
MEMFLVVGGWSYEGEDIPGGRVVVSLEEAKAAAHELELSRHYDAVYVFKLVAGQPPLPVAV